jgi:hypothetical protein
MPVIENGLVDGRKYALLSEIRVDPFSQPNPAGPDSGGPNFGEYGDQLSYLRHHQGGHIFDKVQDSTSSAERRIAGRFLYAGPLIMNFSHFAAEHVSRLVSNNDFKLDGILFVAVKRYRDKVQRIDQYVHEALSFFGLSDLEIVVVEEPCVVEELLIVEQGEQLRFPPNELYLTKLKTIMVSREIGLEKTEKIFISRSGLDKGKLAGEEYIEQLLADHGYRSIRPEKLRWLNLLDLASNASEIVITEGGATHALSLLGEIHANMVILARRPPISKSREGCLLPMFKRAKATISVIDAVDTLLNPVIDSPFDSQNALTLINPFILFNQLSIRLNIKQSIGWNKEAFVESAINDFHVYLQTSFVTRRTDSASSESIINTENQFDKWITKLRSTD